MSGHQIKVRTKCSTCNGEGVTSLASWKTNHQCASCEGVGFFEEYMDLALIKVLLDEEGKDE